MPTISVRSASAVITPPVGAPVDGYSARQGVPIGVFLALSF
jgi:hypothetical protein